MKNLLKKFSFVALVIAFAFAVVGCGNNKHTHKYGENDKCSCGQLNPDHVHEYVDGKCICGQLDDHKHVFNEDTAQCECGAYNYSDPKLYYQSAQSEDLGSVNYWNSKESTVGNLIGYVHNGFWGTRMNEYKDGFSLAITLYHS